MDISIIVRFRDEEAFLPAVLSAVREQICPSVRYEVVSIDNRSSDNSLNIAKQFSDVVLEIDDYRPGAALNAGIAQSRGRYIVILSAHALPSDRNWLTNLYSCAGDPYLAGAYGAQLYEINSKFLDKQDLDIFSTTVPRIERVDSDFWNANSLISRELWERNKFEETVFELEDHYWTKQVLPLGFHVKFEPSALVYHYSHIERNDREFLSESTKDEKDRIEDAIFDLNDADSDWPTIMRAGLTLSSLSQVREIVRAVPALGNVLLTHADFDVRWRMAGALGKIHDRRAAEYLVSALADSSFYVRDEAAWSLARLGAIGAEVALDYTKRARPEELPLLALALGCSGNRVAEERAVHLISSEFESGVVERQRDAAYVAGEIVNAHGSESLVLHIKSLLATGEARLLPVCTWAIGNFAAKANRDIDWVSIQSLAREHPSMLTRFEAVVALGKHTLVEPSTRAVESVAVGLRDRESRVRFAAMQSLRRLLECLGPPLLHSLSSVNKIQNCDDDDFGVMFESQLIASLTAKETLRPAETTRYC